MNELAVKNNDAIYSVMEKVVAGGDLSKLSPKERMQYYHAVCESLDLNPLTRPFQFISFDGKMQLYASKDCTEQLRCKRKISILKIEKETIEGVFVYTAYAKAADGQEDVASGAVTIKGLTGKALANAFKISETQAKRRVTLSICGLGWTDESEVPDVPNAKPLNVDFETGEIINDPVPVLIDQSNPERETVISAIKEAADLTALKTAFELAKELYGKSLPKEFISLKDDRKAYLEDKMVKEFNAEIDAATGN